MCALGILGWTLTSLIGGRSKSGPLQKDEAEMMQAIYQGLSRMERRIETLETLLLEREGRS